MSKKYLLATAAAVMTSGLLSSPSFASDSIQWSDTYVSYRHQFNVKDPGTRADIDEDAVNISYANGWTYGSNFVSLDLEQFSHGDPANSLGSQSAESNSAEFYGVFRTVLSGNKISGTKSFSWGPIKDIGLELGLDWCTQNDQFASYKRLIVVGPQFSIDVPKGFLDFSIHAAHEWNNNAFASVSGSNGTGTNFEVVPEFEAAWLFPFSVGPVPLKFTGFANVIGPKGSGGSGDSKHEMEILVHPKLLVDVGTLVGYQANKIDAGVGYEYWYNKFGNGSHFNGGGELQNSVFLEVGYHW